MIDIKPKFDSTGFSYLTNLLLCIIMSGTRIAGHKSKTFQAISHMYVGGLFAVAFIKSDKFFWAAAVIVSLVELFCFLKGV